MIYICDSKDMGCAGCKLCDKLTYDSGLPLATLNLKSSGLCEYQCPDCYAKRMQRFLTACEKLPCIFNRIEPNTKQRKGGTHKPPYNVRVAVNANFNSTKEEFEELQLFEELYPENNYFINSNIKTEGLEDNDYKKVVTVNPDIKVEEKHFQKLKTLLNVAFVRVKFVARNRQIIDLIKQLKEDGYNIVVTLMRFLNYKSLSKYANKEDYVWRDSYWRLKPNLASNLHLI